MDEEDPVVEEVPVFLSKSLAEHLYVLQFSTKETNHKIDCNDVVNSCVKPHNQQAKIDFGLDTSSKNYDDFRGSQLAVGADGKQPGKGERPSFPSGTMDKMSFVSSKALQNSENYVIGVVQDREVYTTPLKGILQMRPSFSYFDKQDARRRAEQKNDSDAEEEEEVKQVTVKFARNDSDKAKKAREKTFDYMAAREAEEPWCETFWHPTTSTAVELERQKLFCTKTDPTGHTLSATSRDYVKALIPPDRHDKSVENVMESSGVISLFKLKDLGLQEQIKNILIDVKMVSLSQLLAIINDRTVTEEKVVRILPLVGILIRGNWVVQSEILYPAESFSSINGIPSEIMCKSRDYVLYQLVKRNFVERQKISLVIQLPPEEVKEILQSVAQVTSRGWELPLMPDGRFESKYPELVQRQEIFWRSKEDLFADMELEKMPKRVRKRSIRESSKQQQLADGKINGQT